MPEAVSKLPTIFSAIGIRAVLILHNCLTVWRVVIAQGSASYWALSAGNLLTVIEGILVIRYNGGLEWKWWCPCFFTYLLSTLPAIWLLQLSQYETFVNSQQQPGQSNSFLQPALLNNITTVNTITTRDLDNIGSSTASVPLSTESPFEASINAILSLQQDTWIILIQESLVYLLVLGRWILPRSSFSREALADLLLQFLAVASDIMELYAIFDEDKVRTHLRLTYTILTVWSISFLQFIPVLVHKRKYRRLRSAHAKRILRACGDYFAQVVATCLSIVLQDAPFLCLRLYVMLEFNLITYSLVFFVLKNIVSLLLLLYRLVFLCIHLPGCYVEERKIVDVDDVNFSAPVLINKSSPQPNISMIRQSNAPKNLVASHLTLESIFGQKLGSYEKPFMYYLEEPSSLRNGQSHLKQFMPSLKNAGH